MTILYALVFKHESILTLLDHGFARLTVKNNRISFPFFRFELHAGFYSLGFYLNRAYAEELEYDAVAG